MSEIRAYLEQMSIVGGVPIVGVLLFLLSAILTMHHAEQERRGKLWRQFGAIAGVRIPDWLGLALFFFVLALTLWFAALVGMTGIFGPSWGAAALGVVIGARLADTAFSHVRLHLRGFRPNPGLASTPFYVIEAVVLVAIFSRGIEVHYTEAGLGALASGLLFFSIIPFLGWFRRFPRLRQERWRAGEPIPAAAQP